MSSLQPAQTPLVGETATPSLGRRLRSRLLNRGRLYLVLWLLMLPTIGTMLLFNYYPKLDAIKYSFYDWNGSFIEEFVGLKNYFKAIEDFRNHGEFSRAFNLVMVLFATNLLKMWPCIFAAIALHRLRSDRARYMYQVLFVIPMVIPGLVWLLIWKSFYDPNVGILNIFLNATGLMDVLHGLDSAMPQLAYRLQSVRSAGLDQLFGNPFGLVLLGAALLIADAPMRVMPRRWFGWGLAILLGHWLVPGGILRAALLCLAGLSATQAMRLALARPAQNTLAPRAVGACVIALGGTLVALSMVWTQSLGVFKTGSPSWLGHEDLIIPAVIFWGFPWVGTIGVLIYLAGLQSISNDVYEAADLDGVGPLRKIFAIELPLVMTQVRINLIFMTIGTLNDYGLFFILLGVGGGPGGRGNVPGLVMYREAFQNTNFGYACGLGMVLFCMILVLTIVYQKYVRVEK